MELQKLRFTVGQVVFGKIKGYPHWPALITEIHKNTATVVWFNWNDEISKISFGKLTPYHAGRRFVETHYGRHGKFTKACDEMECVLRFKLEQQRMEREAKKRKFPMIIIHRLSPTDIERIKRELKQETSKQTPTKMKKQLRSGRKF